MPASRKLASREQIARLEILLTGHTIRWSESCTPRLLFHGSGWETRRFGAGSIAHPEIERPLLHALAIGQRRRFGHGDPAPEPGVSPLPGSADGEPHPAAINARKP